VLGDLVEERGLGERRQPLAEGAAGRNGEGLDGGEEETEEIGPGGASQGPGGNELGILATRAHQRLGGLSDDEGCALGEGEDEAGWLASEGVGDPARMHQLHARRDHGLTGQLGQSCGASLAGELGEGAAGDRHDLTCTENALGRGAARTEQREAHHEATLLGREVRELR
jgi:hypothetical protein